MRRIGVAECERNGQERAVEGWLRDNTPKKVLAVSLRRDGFLDETCQTTCQTNHDAPGRMTAHRVPARTALAGTTSTKAHRAEQAITGCC